MKSKLLILGFLSTLILISCNKKEQVKVKGELKTWHRVSLDVQGPDAAELDPDNPFLNYRLNVEFSKGEKLYSVPGFFAADGNAADSGSDSGAIWQVRFIPEIAGKWTFSAKLYKNKSIFIFYM